MLSSNPTLQEVFDHILTAMRKQRCASIGTTKGRCLYRGLNEAKCPVGHCISDADYNVEMDTENGQGNGVCSLARRGLLVGNLAWMANPVMLNKLFDLQCMHDRMALNFHMPSYEDAMYFFAETNKLTYQPHEVIEEKEEALA